MAEMQRKLVWVERQSFYGWACSECVWVFDTAGPPVGESVDEMTSHYEQRRDNEFTSHVCSEHPKTKKPKS